METKRLIVVMVIGMALILAWPQVVDRIAKMGGYELPKAPTTQAAVDLAPTSGPTTSSTAIVSTVLPTTGATAGATTGATSMPGGWSANAATVQAAVETIGSDATKDPVFALQLAVNPRGAGLEHVILNDYKLTLKKGEPFTFQTPGSTFVEQTRSLAVRSVTVDGTTIDLTGQVWSLVDAKRSPSAQVLTYELPLSRDGKVELVLRRIYTVFPRNGETWKANNVEAEPLGFEAAVVTSFENRTDRPLSVSFAYNAQTIPPTEAERYADGSYIVGLAKDGIVAPVSHMVDSIKDPTDLLTNTSGQVPYWLGASTSYFMAMERFEPAPSTSAPADWFKSVTARTLTPEAHGAQREDEVIVATKDTVIAPHSQSAVASRAYFGPRRREVLANAHYSAPWIQYNRALVIISGICGICTWQWLIDILFTILKAFHAITQDWGLSIIGLVVLVRLCLHPISKRAQLNMLKFGKLAPEMERIKKKYADDQEAMNRAMMGFYKEHGSTQLMGCLPMFLQMPVWIALWQAMNTTFELRQAPFLYNLTWIHDLSKPDHLIDFANYGMQPIHLPLLSFITISGINVLPFLYGLVQFIQFKIQPKPPTMTEEQAQQQKMTQWMILFMMPVMLYASPSGLMIYMITSFGIGIAESKLVKRQFAHMTENEAKFTVIDADSPAAAKAEKAVVRRKEPAAKKTGLFAMLNEARERAAEMQREIEKNRKKR